MIIGAGGVGHEAHQAVLDINRASKRWNFLGFLDDDPKKLGTTVHGARVLGEIGWLEHNPSAKIIVGLGAPAARLAMVKAIEAIRPDRFATLIHPTAQLGHDIRIGVGSIVLGGTILECDNNIGDHSIINLSCSLGHETVLGDFTVIGPGVRVAGRVKVGTGTDVGIGASIIQDLRIGEWSIVGAGAAVVDDISDNVTAVGVPAKTIKRRPPGWHLK